MSTPIPERVLVPLGGPLQTQAALEYATAIPDAEITLLAVIDPFDVDPETFGYQSPIGRAGMPGYTERSYEPVKADVRDRFVEARQTAAASDVVLSTTIEFGRPARSIVHYAETHGIDHIVIGNRRRPWLSRTVFASTAERVVRRSRVPVTVVGG